jgi:hypothetical protein
MEVMLEGKLTKSEAMAVQLLATDPNWQKFKEYVTRIYIKASNQCETCKDDHRFHQGKAVELKLLVNIEAKAHNILNGT